MPWWGKSKEPKEPAPAPSPQADSPQPNQSFDPDKLPPREKLPVPLQSIVDKSDSDSIFDEVVDGYAPPTTETKLRYAAYATRIRTILLSAHRYVAYTSDIGESFRPVAHPRLVRAAYGVSWLYIFGDVSYEGYRAYWHNQRIVNPQLRLTARQEKITGLPAEHDNSNLTPGVVSPLEDWRTVMVQRGIFQSLASMGLPAFTIHSVVRYSGQALKKAKSRAIRTWGPIGLGLSVVPFLPQLFDEPVENAVEWVFHKGFQAFGGREYVGNTPATGREDLLKKPVKPKAE